MIRVLVVFIAVLATSVTAGAGVITVDCNGGGDFTNLPQAILWATSDDTVLVAPCVYEVTPGYPPYVPGYPIRLTDNGPKIMSSGGAEVTIIEGDGTLSAFEVHDGDYCRVSLRGLTIRNVDWPIEVVGFAAGGSWRIHDNVFEDCGHTVIAMYGGGGISGNVIRNSPGNGLSLEYFNGPVSGNEVSYCGGNGIVGITGEGGLVSGNHVHHNTGRGISLGIYTRATDNIVEYNGTGIGAGCVGTSFNDFQGNVIRYNGVGFLQLYDVPANVHDNDIYANTEYNFVVDVEYYGPDIDATGNWWGTTDPDEIAAGILDVLDDPSLAARVLFDPWCDSPGCQGTPVRPSSWGAIKALYR